MSEVPLQASSGASLWFRTASGRKVWCGKRPASLRAYNHAKDICPISSSGAKAVAPTSSRGGLVLASLA